MPGDGPGTFGGFGEDATAFYEGLEADNSKAYWTDHFATYERSVRAPMLALLAPEFGEGRMFRPYRDVRFGADKSPYKTTAAALVTRPGGSSYYVQLSAVGLMAGAGNHTMSTDQLARFRRAVADDVVGSRLESEVRHLRASGYGVGGPSLRTAPRGWDAAHPRIELLRHKGIYAYREWQEEPLLTLADCADAVAAAWRDYAEIVAWLDANVGAAEEARRR